MCERTELDEDDMALMADVNGDDVRPKTPPTVTDDTALNKDSALAAASAASAVTEPPPPDYDADVDGLYYNILFQPPTAPPCVGWRRHAACRMIGNHAARKDNELPPPDYDLLSMQTLMVCNYHYVSLCLLLQ